MIREAKLCLLLVRHTMNIYEGKDKSGSVQKQMSIPGLSSRPWQKEKHVDLNIFSKSSEFTHFESVSVNPFFLEDRSLFFCVI